MPIRNAIVAASAAILLVACDSPISEPATQSIETMEVTVMAAGIELPAICDGPATKEGAPGPGWPYIYGTENDDKLVHGDADYAVLIYGRAGNDCLIGGAARNSLFGEGGDDVLIGMDGDNYLDGGPGVDLLIGGNGNEIFVADDGESDTIIAGRGHDVIYALDGAIDTIDCGPGRDVVYADPFDVLRQCEMVNPSGRR